MAWQDEIIGFQATYNGVPFKIRSVDFDFGWQLNDFTPQEDGAGISEKATLSFGKKANTKQTKRLPKTFGITASFSGPDYIDERNAFIDQIEKGGSGLLIIPTFDQIIVNPAAGRSRFENNVGGYEEVAVTFREAGDREQPETSLNTEKAAIGGIDDSKATFIESFTTKLESGAQWVADASSDLTELVSTTINDTLGLGAVGDGLEAVTEASNTLAQNATTLIYTPTVLANQISDTISALTLAFEQPANAFNAQLQLLENYGIIDSSTGATPTEQDAIDNNNAFVQIVNNAAVAEAGRAAVLTEYESLDDAQLAKSRFEAAARAQQLVNGNTEGYDEGYREIANIIALVSDHITAQGELPSSIDVTYPDSNAALVLAEDLYGDADRAAEIVTRNDARHPLFLPNELTLLSF
jgi:prophage DNA circulation protein